MEVVEETQLIAECQAGNLQPFGGLYDTYVSRIYKFIYYKTMHQETAQDLTSQVFLKAIKNINGYNSTKGTFSSWLYRIARNTVIDFYRTKKSNSSIEDAWDLSSDDDIERDLETKQRLQAVQEYLQQLPSEQRDIVLLRVWEGLSYKEIAAIMGKTEASCKMSFSRTINTLRTQNLTAFMLLLAARIVI